MPVSVVCETTASVNAALRESLGSGGGSCSAAANAKANSSSLHQDDHKINGSSSSHGGDDADSLHGKLVASAKRVLLSKIDYEEVTNYGQSVLESLKSKYIVLKPSMNNNSMENGRNSPATCNNNNGANGDSAAGKCTCNFFYNNFFVFLFPYYSFFFLFLLFMTRHFFFISFFIWYMKKITTPRHIFVP